MAVSEGDRPITYAEALALALRAAGMDDEAAARFAAEWERIERHNHRVLYEERRPRPGALAVAAMMATTAYETCGCGASIDVRTEYQSDARAALAEWREGHRCRLRALDRPIPSLGAIAREVAKGGRGGAETSS